MKQFSELYRKYNWREIHGCPGRYTMAGAVHIPLSELTGENNRYTLYKSEKTKDPFYVIPIGNGGIISYVKKEGFLIHTLNSEEGFKRKLEDLGIDER